MKKGKHGYREDVSCCYTCSHSMCGYDFDIYCVLDVDEGIIRKIESARIGV
jgi:hypothetical protein